MAKIYFPFVLSPRTGGDYVNVEHIQTLRQFGVDARVFFIGNDIKEADAFGDLPVVTNDKPLSLMSNDIIILPESLPGVFKQCFNPKDFMSQVRVIMHNQNPLYNFICGQSIREFNANPMERIIVPSAYAARRLQEMGATKPLNVIHPYIPDMFTLGAKSREPIRIAFSSRKRAFDVQAVKFYFNSIYHYRFPLEFVDLVNMPREKVAEEMRNSAIFASFAENESLGLMALEAMASGCHVVGFSGHTGGHCEYFTEQNGDWIAEGDYLAFAKKLTAAIDLFASGAENPKVQAGIATVEQHFRKAHFEQAVRAVYSDILGYAI